jgi:hypothetical protein
MDHSAAAGPARARGPLGRRSRPWIPQWSSLEATRNQALVCLRIRRSGGSASDRVGQQSGDGASVVMGCRSRWRDRRNLAMITDMPTPDRQNAQAAGLDAALARLADVLRASRQALATTAASAMARRTRWHWPVRSTGFLGTCCPGLPPRSRTTGATTTTCTASSRLASWRCLSTTTCTSTWSG